MKKLIAMLLALIMVCSLATVAFALDSNGSDTDFVLKKLYTVNGEKVVDGAEVKDATTPSIYPHEKLTFTVEADSSNPDTDLISVADLEVNGLTNQTMEITLPVYEKVGEYVYTITEVAPTPNTQGVSYVDEEDKITVTVLVTYDYGGEGTADDKLVANLYLTQKNGTFTEGGEGTEESEIIPAVPAEGENPGSAAVYKVDTFVNTYDLGHMTLSKAVTGNLADESAYFEFTVDFTSDKPVLSDITIAGTTSWTGDNNATNPTSIAYTSWENNGKEAEGETAAVPATEWTKSVTIWLKHGETVQFLNIPAGVEYTVTESENHLVGDDDFDVNSETNTDYTASYKVDNAETAIEGNVVTGESVKETMKTIAFTNEKSTSVETGIALDSAPYILMLVVAMVGMVALVSKKRYEV